MPLRILHTGDIHLGAKFIALGNKGPEQRQQLLATFDDLVQLAVDEGVDLVLLAGDLFDSEHPSKDVLERVYSRLESLTGRDILVFISPGTHDRYGPGSPYAVQPLSTLRGLTVFKSEHMAPVHVPELDCTVFGNANMHPYENKYPLSGFSAAGDSRWKVGMLHAGFEIPDVIEDTYLVTADQVAGSGLDYLALGHLHSTSDRSVGGVTAFYCGAPEMISIRKGDFGNALLVDLDGEARVRPVRTGRRTFQELMVRAEDVQSSIALATMLEPLADPDRVLKLSVEGLRQVGHPDIQALAEEFAGRFFHIAVSDRSRPAPTSVDPDVYPEGSPARTFLRALESRLEGASEPEREEIMEAMQVGLSLLGEGGE